MTDWQKEVASIVALIMIAAIVLLISIFALIIPIAAPSGETVFGSIYLGVIHSQADSKIVIGAVLAIVSIVSALAGKSKTPTMRIYISIALCVIGLFASLILLLAIDQPGVARPLWAYSPFETIQSYGDLLAANHRFLIAVSGWLGAQLLTMLAIKAIGGKGGA